MKLRLLLYEPGTQRVSPATLRLPNKWTSGFAVKHPKPDDLLQEPYLGFGDSDDDGEPDVVVERYGHNGTMYNAVLDYVFSIQDDLSLAPLLVLEARVDDIGYVTGGTVSGDIEREFVSLGAGARSAVGEVGCARASAGRVGGGRPDSRRARASVPSG